MYATSFVAQQLRLGTIEARNGRRPVNQGAVDRLAESMAEIGLQQLITVKRKEIGEGGGYWLVTGAHRLAAARQLGWETIPTYIVQMSDRDARLWEISENLHRAELTVGERADQIAEWISLTDTSEVSTQVVSNPQGGRPEGGTRAAARELGVNREEARRAVRIASIAPEAREAAREAGLDDNQSVLLTVAAAPHEQQVAAVAVIVEARATPRQKTPKTTPPVVEVEPEATPESGSESDALFNRFLRLDRERRSEFTRSLSERSCRRRRPSQSSNRGPTIRARKAKH
jgi:ParB-like chromosome segregation protein Spo0J